MAGVAAATHPAGRHARSGASDRTLRMWGLDGGDCRHVLEGHTGAVTAVACHPDGRYAISSADDDTLRVWDLDSGACRHVLEGHPDAE